MEYEFRKDKFRRTRGGTSEFYNIYCSACTAHIALYQKDGRGALIRLYVDRIMAPEYDPIGAIKCPSCNSLIATPMVYEKENRQAFRLVHGAIQKRRSDGHYPPENK